MILGPFTITKKFPRPFIRQLKLQFGEKPLVGVEIGIFKGETTLSMLKNLNISELYLIDPYDFDDAYFKIQNGLLCGKELTKETLKEAEQGARRKLADYSNQLTWIKRTSDAAASDIPNNLDFVYIDADHTYEHVKRDLEHYYPKVKKGGLVAGHDINNKREEFGVVKAVCEFAKGKRLRIEKCDFMFTK